MNSTDLQYQLLLRLVLSKGRWKNNRTGVKTLGVFGAQARYDLSEGFPLLTTKKMAIKSIIHELFWFIAGDTNIKYLVENGCNIWNANAFDRYQKINKGSDTAYTNIEDYVSAIKSANMLNDDDHTFVSAAGELGEGTYGGMWRAFPYYLPSYGGYNADNDCAETGAVDQLQKAIDKLKNSPDDRRIIVSAWHPYWVDHCALPPCHVLFHFNTEELTLNERRALVPQDALDANEESPIQVARETLSHDSMDQMAIPTRRLNCLLYQRSCDLFLGVPFNITSYSLLTAMVAHCVNMVPGEFVHTYGDLHLYEDHIDQAKLQLSREPFKLPTLKINPAKRDLFDIGFDDIKIEGYESHPAIAAKMAV